MLRRTKKKFSQAKLGRSISASGDVISRYERGYIIPSIEVVAKMADALEVSADYLIGKSSLLYDQTLIKPPPNYPKPINRLYFNSSTGHCEMLPPENRILTGTFTK